MGGDPRNPGLCRAVAHHLRHQPGRLQPALHHVRGSLAPQQHAARPEGRRASQTTHGHGSHQAGAGRSVGQRTAGDHTVHHGGTAALPAYGRDHRPVRRVRGEAQPDHQRHLPRPGSSGVGGANRAGGFGREGVVERGDRRDPGAGDAGFQLGAGGGERARVRRRQGRPRRRGRQSVPGHLPADLHGGELRRAVRCGETGRRVGRGPGEGASPVGACTADARAIPAPEPGGGFPVE